MHASRMIYGTNTPDTQDLTTRLGEKAAAHMRREGSSTHEERTQHTLTCTERGQNQPRGLDRVARLSVS